MMLPEAGPDPSWGYIAARSGDGQAVIFGGTQADGTNTVVLRTTHLWDARADTLALTDLTADGPAPRYCGCAAWDRERDVVVMVGGRNRDGPFAIPGETWELSVADARWRLVPVTTPPGVIGCAMTFAGGAIHLFGGLGERVGYDRTLYRYEPESGWVGVPGEGPTGRFDAAIETLPDGDTFVLVGGAAAAAGAAFYADVWTFDVGTGDWRELVAEGLPTGRRAPWVIPDEDGRGVYVGFGLDGETQPLADLYHVAFDAPAYRPVSLADRPEGRGLAPALPAARGLGALVYGYDGVGPRTDAWVLHAE
jgi:hypothetical protein